MTPLVIGFGALVLGLIIGGIVVLGTPVFGIPIIVFALIVLGAAQLRRQRREAEPLTQERRRATGEKVEFTERDRETLSEHDPRG